MQHHSKLNNKQLALLHIVYRFRFATTDLVARYQGRGSHRTVYPRLQPLVKRGYIDRSFEPAYRLKGKLYDGRNKYACRVEVQDSDPVIMPNYLTIVSKIGIISTL